jgi:hypothetical protein
MLFAFTLIKAHYRVNNYNIFIVIGGHRFKSANLPPLLKLPEFLLIDLKQGSTKRFCHGRGDLSISNVGVGLLIYGCWYS